MKAETPSKQTESHLESYTRQVCLENTTSDLLLGVAPISWERSTFDGEGPRESAVSSASSGVVSSLPETESLLDAQGPLSTQTPIEPGESMCISPYCTRRTGAREPGILLHTSWYIALGPPASRPQVVPVGEMQCQSAASGVVGLDTDP